MKPGFGTLQLQALVAMGALFAIIGLGFVLRLADPLSSTVIPAEDPYTHMANVREHLRTGDLSPLTEGAALYPPGLHALLAATWVFTGADLYQIILLGPAFFGALGVLGMGLLLWRHAGPVAALVGSLGFAVAPEVIFRTTMMSPTAQDMALLPFFLYAMLEVVEGRRAWAGIAAPLALFLAYSHPWLFAILAVMTAVSVALAYLLPLGNAVRDRASARGAATAIAIVGGALALTLSSWVNIVQAMREYASLAWVLFVLSFAPIIVLLALPRATAARLRGRPRDRPLPLLARAAASLLIALALGWATWKAIGQGLPPLVDLPRMLGWPILALAGLGLVLLPFLPGRLAHVAAGLFAATYPFVIFNPLDSPYWSHRTVAFLSVSLMILAGVTAAALARVAAAAVSAYHRAPAPSGSLRLRRIATLVPALLVLSVCVGTVYAGTPDGYAGGWYRLYPECELDALKEAAALANAAPAAVVVVGSWEPKLVLSALTHDSDRVWNLAAFFTDAERRSEDTFQLGREGRPVIVVVDRFLVSEHPGSLGFLDDGSWELKGSWCAGQGTGQPRVLAYEWRGVE